MSDDSRLDSEELIYRAIIPNKPEFKYWSNKKNRPSTANFKKQNGGVSVDRKLERSEDDVVYSLEHKFDLQAIIKWRVGVCNNKCCVLADEMPENKYHAVIVNEKCKKEDPFLSSSQALFVARNCEIVIKK